MSLLHKPHTRESATFAIEAYGWKIAHIQKQIQELYSELAEAADKLKRAAEYLGS